MNRVKMVEKARFLIAVATLISFMVVCSAIESPGFTVVHEESDFEIRLYRDSVWMTAPVKNEPSFHQATKFGFHRLFQFIEGANLNCSRIPMTAPVITSIVLEAGPLHSSAYVVGFYLPFKFQETPPLPMPQLNISPERWSSRCIAVRKFSGFARDHNVVKEAQELSNSLSKSPWADSTSSESDFAYTIAQYSSPFKIVGRVNEVWVELKESASDGCKSSGVANY